MPSFEWCAWDGVYSKLQAVFQTRTFNWEYVDVNLWVLGSFVIFLRGCDWGHLGC